MKTIFLACVALLFGPSLAHAKGSAPIAADPVNQLNAQFRTACQDARQRAQDRLDSVFIAYSGDKLVWLKKGARREASYLPQIYHDLKTTAHLPLALFVLLERPSAEPLDSATRLAVEQLMAQAQQAARIWSTRGFTPEQLKRQMQLLQACQAFANDSLRRGRFWAPAEMYGFVQSLRAPLGDNIREAARMHLDALHKQTQIWRKEMGEAAWDKLYTVVVTPHMPMQNELTTQYFMQAMRQTEEGSRLVVAQSPTDETQAMQLLATHQLDGGIGERFFDNPMRMHRDLLGDAVTEYLNNISVSAAP